MIRQIFFCGILWIAGSAATAAVLANFDAFEWVYEISRSQEDWELDEIILSTVSALLIFAFIGGVLLFRLNSQLLSAFKEAQLARQHAQKSADIAVMANSSKTRFLANMSHELRTPLNAISGFNQMILMDPKLEGDTGTRVRQYATHVQTASDTLCGLVDGLLELSDVESGQITVSVEDFPILPFLKEVAFSPSPLVPEHGNRLIVRDGNKCDVSHDHPSILHADKGLLARCCVLLLRSLDREINAGELIMAFSSCESCPDLSQHRTCKRSGDQTPSMRMGCITLSAPAVTWSKARLKELSGSLGDRDAMVASSANDSSLTLPLVQHYMGCFGGSVEVEQHPDYGASFRLLIPCWPPGSPAVESNGSQMAASASSVGAKTATGQA